MQKKYEGLFKSDALIETLDGREEYLNLLFGGGDVNDGIVKEMRQKCYNKWHEAVTKNPIVDVSEIVEEENAKNDDQTATDVSSVLITKVLMGVYGCIPAYDRYVMDGLKTQNINATFGRKAVTELLNATVVNKKVKSNIEFVRGEITASTNKKYTDFPLENYTFMKVVDMLFWEIGAGAVVSVNRNQSQKAKLKDLSDEDKRIIEQEATSVIENTYKRSKEYTMRVGEKDFSSKDIGALLMCVYNEFKVPDKELKKKEVKTAIQGTKNGNEQDGLEWNWIATTRFSPKLVR